MRIFTAAVFFFACVAFGAGLSTQPQSTSLSSRAEPTQYGLFYLFFHCLANPEHYDISKALSGEQPWGAVGTWHWWSKPAKGYYCALNQRNVFREHAEQIRDAGIDFVFVDITNFAQPDGQAPLGATDPLKAMIEEWKKVPRAPKIVAWLPLSPGAKLPDVVDQILSTAPEMLFQFRGKPLLLVVDQPAFPVDDTLWKRFSAKYTLRRMWANPQDSRTWSFMNQCQEGFKDSEGRAACKQKVAMGPDGSVEQVSVATAYQANYMSNSDATPKFRGRTLQAQMKRIDDFKNPPIVTITGWNEWVAIRFCVKRGAPVIDCTGASDRLPNGNRVFVDQYDEEFNRDLEPGGASGDFYYQLLKREVLSRKGLSSSGR